MTGKAERTVLAEVIRDALSEAVKDHSEPAPDGSLSFAEEAAQQSVALPRRPGKSNTWPEVLLVPVVVARLPIRGTRPIKGDRRIVPGTHAIGGLFGSVLKPILKIKSRLHLQFVRFPRRREQRPPQPKRECESWFNLPHVLPIELVAVDCEPSLECRPIGKRTAVSLEVI